MTLGGPLLPPRRRAFGARADLVLHDRDPRVGLSSFVTPAGVMAAGRWYPGRWLQDRLERLRHVR